MRIRAILVVVLASLIFALPVMGQAVVRGTLTGKVTADNGEGLPGVSVTVTSPSLQGQRTVFSGANGEFIIRDLPAGQYEASFELEGMAKKLATTTVEVGQLSRLEVTMSLSALEETIVVQGETANAMENVNISGNFDYGEINALAQARTLGGIALLAPGVNSNTQVAGQIQVNGAFSFDNVFLVDGVDVTDSVFATANPLYIEDAIAETQVQTSGISAEYGRFTGGIVNAITKSGGNQFSGTLRMDVTNPAWRDETPFEKSEGIKRESDRNEIYSATLGGYIVKDKLWFFAAGRDADTSRQDLLSYTGIPFSTQSTDQRLEGKLTLNIQDRHTVQATYTDTDQSSVRPSTSVGSDLTTIEDIKFPSKLAVGRYSGVLSARAFLEAQYSQKDYGFRHIPGSGGISTDIRDSPIRCWNVSPSCHYNGVYFDATDPEDRNNEQLAASFSYLLDGGSAGSHDLKVGYEDFTNINVGGNSQSATDWVFFADFATNPDGSPLVVNNELQPSFVPFDSLGVRFAAQRGARLELEVSTVYVNDRWHLNDHWSFNLGFRYEDVSSKTNAGKPPVNTDAVVPRLAASYDIKGNGKYRIDLTYGEYSGGYGFGGNLFATVTNVGNPNYVYGIYVGPPGEGKNFAPGFDPDNYFIVGGAFGADSVSVAPGLSSPTVEEYTLSFGRQLPRGGFIRASYVNRSAKDFVLQTIDQGTGSVEILRPDLGMNFPSEFSRTVLENSSKPTRDYEGTVVQGRYRVRSNLTVEGQWTHQLKNEGDYEGEAGQGFGSSNHTSYPEFLDRRNYAFGRLDEFQKDRARLWAIYNLGLGRAGQLDLSLLYNYDSGSAYSYSKRINLTNTQLALDPGYATLPTQPTLWFGKRGAATFPSYQSFDFGTIYSLPIFKSLEVFLKADVFNIFNDKKLIAYNTTIDVLCPPGGCDGATNGVTDANARLDSLGRPLDFQKSASFGEATSNASYNTPREYRFSVGFRF